MATRIRLSDSQLHLIGEWTTEWRIKHDIDHPLFSEVEDLRFKVKRAMNAESEDARITRAIAEAAQRQKDLARSYRADVPDESNNTDQSDDNR